MLPVGPKIGCFIFQFSSVHNFSASYCFWPDFFIFGDHFRLPKRPTMTFRPPFTFTHENWRILEIYVVIFYKFSYILAICERRPEMNSGPFGQSKMNTRKWKIKWQLFRRTKVMTRLKLKYETPYFWSYWKHEIKFTP